MPSIIRSTSIAANGSNPNLFTGDQFEFMRGNGAFSMGLNAAATGLFASMSAGSDLIAAEFAVPFTAVLRYPIIPDDFYLDGAALQGDRLVCAVRNSTAGAIIIDSVIKIAYQ